MTGLEATVGTVHRLLRGEIDPAEASRLLGAPESRLAVYAGFVRQHVRTALEKNYTALPPLLGKDDWNALVDRYFEECPPADYELNAAAEGFKGFLAARAETGAHGVTAFHVALANLEWLEWVVYSSEAVIPSPSEVDCPTLNPTLAIMETGYPVADWLRGFRSSLEDGRPLPATPDHDEEHTVFVFRSPSTMKSVIREADASLLFAFKVAYEGLGMARAAEVSGLKPDRVAGILSGAAETGLIILPDPE